jgi:hypothetical protein
MKRKTPGRGKEFSASLTIEPDNQVEPVLQEVDAQHSLHTNRPAACAFR